MRAKMIEELIEADPTSVTALPEVHLLVLGFLDMTSIRHYLATATPSAGLFPLNSAPSLFAETPTRVAEVRAFTTAIAPSVLASFRASLLPWPKCDGWAELRSTLGKLGAWEVARRRLPRSPLPNGRTNANDGCSPLMVASLPAPSRASAANHQWWKVVALPDAHVSLSGALEHTLRMRAALAHLAGAPAASTARTTTAGTSAATSAGATAGARAATFDAGLKLRQVAMASTLETVRAQWRGLRGPQAARARADAVADAAAQAEAVRAAALWYGQGQAARCLAAHFRAETLDRRTGGALTFEATVALAPRHLAPSLLPHLDSSDDGGVFDHAAVELVFSASVKCNDTSMMRVYDFGASCRYCLYGGDAAQHRTLYNLRSHGAATVGGPPADWTPHLVAELSTALFGRPVGRRLLGAFLVAALNPGGGDDGGAFR